MLSLVLGEDRKNNADAVLAHISEDISAGKDHIILLVPELISHEAERRLCVFLGDTACRYAEVLTFTSLTRRVCEYAGRPIPKCLDNGGRMVAMASAARQLHSKLKAYASVETKPEFLSGLLDAVDEFKRCCISSVDLKAASENASGAFAQKLEELSLILDAYNGVCQQGQCDPRDQMTVLLELLSECDFAETHTFYIDGFPDFSRQHLEILYYLICNAKNVTVSLNCDKIGSERLAFECAGATAFTLRQFADVQEIPVRTEHISPADGAMRILCKNLLQGSAEPQAALSGKLFAYRTQSVFDDCMNAANRISELVRGGARYRDFFVVCPEASAYRNTIHSVFSRCGIPLYQAGTEEILNKPVITTVISAIEAALGGFDQSDVFHYLHSALSPLELAQSDRLENYAVIWNVRYNRFTTPWENHPGGLDKEWTEQAKQELSELNDARKTVMEPLQHLQTALRSAVRLSDQVLAVYDFLDESGFCTRLGELTQQMDDAGDNRSAQILNQLWDILLRALEQLYHVLGNTVWDTDTFFRLFRLLLSQYHVGTIPPVLDSVIFGDTQSMRCHQAKHLIVLGAEEGSFPHYGKSNGVLSDTERAELRQMGIPLNGSALESLQAEFADIYGVFCGAEESVSISCAGAQPSAIFRRLGKLAGGVLSPAVSCDTVIANKSEAAAIFARDGALFRAQAMDLEEPYHRFCIQKEHTLGTISKQSIEKLYGTQLKLSASQIDSQAQCRLAYFLKYGIRVKERREIKIDPAEFGTYVHWVLEYTGREVLLRGGFRAVSEEETVNIAAGLSDQYYNENFSQIDSKRSAYLFERNKQELELVVRELWKELQTSDFQPVQFELGFGDAGKLPAIYVTAKEMSAQIRGFVDRVDVWDENGARYYRIIDYKTGKKSFDYCDIYHGIGLQMLLYLFALRDSVDSEIGDIGKPAGVQYFPARVPHISEDGDISQEEAEAERRKLWKRKGLILGDDRVVRAMEDSDTPARLSCKRTKEGELTGDIASSEQFRMLEKYVYGLIRAMIDDISSGCVEPNPYTRGSSYSACTYCPFDCICREAYAQQIRVRKAISADEFWDSVERSVQ